MVPEPQQGDKGQDVADDAVAANPRRLLPKERIMEPFTTLEKSFEDYLSEAYPNSEITAGVVREHLRHAFFAGAAMPLVIIPHVCRDNQTQSVEWLKVLQREACTYVASQLTRGLEEGLHDGEKD